MIEELIIIFYLIATLNYGLHHLLFDVGMSIWRQYDVIW